MVFPPGISDGAAEAYAEWYSANFLKITYLDWTLYSGDVANPLTPLTAAPTTEEFKLSYLASSSGQVTVTGSRAGAVVVETVDLVAGVLKRGNKTFDSTPSSITCTCPTGTITITCIDLAAKVIKKESTETVPCKFEDYTKVWNEQTTTDARLFCQDATIKGGDKIRFDRTDREVPTNGQDFEVMMVRDKRNPETDALLFKILYVK